LASFQYLKELECPYSSSHSTAVILEWLLGFAVRLEYSENSDKYVKPLDNVVPMSIAGPSRGSDNPLEQLNCTYPLQYSTVLNISTKTNNYNNR